MEQKHKYDSLVHQFFGIKRQLTEQAKKLQNVFDGFRAFLTPWQLSKILVNVEKNKYRKEMNLESMDSFWAYVNIYSPRNSMFRIKCQLKVYSRQRQLRIGAELIINFNRLINS